MQKIVTKIEIWPAKRKTYTFPEEHEIWIKRAHELFAAFNVEAAHDERAVHMDYELKPESCLVMELDTASQTVSIKNIVTGQIVMTELIRDASISGCAVEYGEAVYWFIGRNPNILEKIALGTIAKYGLDSLRKIYSDTTVPA